MKIGIHALAIASLVPAMLFGGSVGVMVNGVDFSGDLSTHPGLTWDGTTLTIAGGGPYCMSGTNQSGAVAVKVCSTATMIISNLVMGASEGTCSPLTVASGSDLTLRIWGDNELTGGRKFAGISVEPTAALDIDAVEGVTEESAKLTAQGGYQSSGIGANSDESSGIVRIHGGVVVARAYSEQHMNAAAGIGGSGDGPSQLIEITGGHVTAVGGYQDESSAPGIGGGGSGAGGEIRISGGYVDAVGGDGAPAIGSGELASGCKILISGGTVVARPNITYGEQCEIGTVPDCFYSEPLPEVTISGGSVCATHISSPKDGNGNAVTLHEIQCSVTNECVWLSGIDDYGQKDIVADGLGKVYIWYAGDVKPIVAIADAADSATRTEVLDALDNDVAEQKVMSLFDGGNATEVEDWIAENSLTGTDIAESSTVKASFELGSDLISATNRPEIVCLALSCSNISFCVRVSGVVVEKPALTNMVRAASQVSPWTAMDVYPSFVDGKVVVPIATDSPSPSFFRIVVPEE